MNKIDKPQFVESFESFMLPFRLLFDWDVPFFSKFVPSLIFVSYLVFPLDFISDLLPIVGIIDDLAILTLCAYLLVRLTPDEIVQKYTKETEKETTPEDKKEILIESKTKSKK